MGFVVLVFPTIVMVLRRILFSYDHVRTTLLALMALLQSNTVFTLSQKMTLVVALLDSLKLELTTSLKHPVYSLGTTLSLNDQLKRFETWITKKLETLHTTVIRDSDSIGSANCALFDHQHIYNRGVPTTTVL